MDIKCYQAYFGPTSLNDLNFLSCTCNDIYQYNIYLHDGQHIKYFINDSAMLHISLVLTYDLTAMQVIKDGKHVHYVLTN